MGLRESNPTVGVLDEGVEEDEVVLGVLVDLVSQGTALSRAVCLRPPVRGAAARPEWRGEREEGRDRLYLTDSRGSRLEQSWGYFLTSGPRFSLPHLLMSLLVMRQNSSWCWKVSLLG